MVAVIDWLICAIHEHVQIVTPTKVAKISLFLEDRGVNHIKHLISVYKLLQIVKTVKFPLLEN